MEHIVLLFFSFFTEAVTLWQYATSLFIPSCSNKIRLPILSALYAILFFLSLLGEMGLNTFSFFVVNTVFLFALFKLKLLLAIFHSVILATLYKGNIIKNLIMDCQSYTKYRPNETTGGIFVSWRRKEELPTGA